jgi:hypothetical protein
MNQRYDVLGFGLILLAAALFAIAGTADDLFTDKSWLFRWQPLIGSLIAATGTVFAGRLAFRRQVAHAAEQLVQSQKAARVKRERDALIFDELKVLLARALSEEDKASWISEVERVLESGGYPSEAVMFRTHDDPILKLRLIVGRMGGRAEAQSEVLADRDQPIS